jgi:putative ABC transport system substrate-binding protein
MSSNGPRIGVLETAAPDPERLALWEFFQRQLKELGNADANFEYRWAQGRTEQLAPLADELVKLGVDVMVTAGTPAAAAASRATAVIPVVMATGVGLGTQLTEGASKPNANVTGISDLPPGVSEKRLTLLRAMVGQGAPLALLCDRGNPSSPLALAETQKAAQPLGIAVKDYWIASANEFGKALPVMKSDGIRGFVVAPGGLFFAQRAALGELAIANGLATITARREYAEAGCLMTYGAPIRENYRQAANYVSQILRGVKPSDLPVDEPTEFDFVINMRTAKALKLTPPQELLDKADIVG